MRFWPKKLWKKIFLALVLLLVLAFVAFGVFAGLLMSGAINREVVSEIEVMNSGATKTALIVHQPGLTSFPRDVTYAFADGLVLSGWRVEVTTASPETPADLSKYSLIVLAYPVYGGTPGTAIVSYLNRISTVNGTNMVILACGGGETGEIENPLKQQTQTLNGTFYKGLTLSNQDGSAIERATQAGSIISP